VKLKALASWIFLYFTSFWRNSYSYEYKNKSHNSYPLVCRRPAETVSLQRRQICYRWGTPAYWSLVPRSSMFTFLNFVWKIRGIVTQQILSHSFYDWKLCELFLLSGFLICHAVGWYIELKNQKFWWRERSWFKVIQKIFRVFQHPHVIYAATRVNSFIIFLLSLFYCRQNLCQVNRQFFRRTSWCERVSVTYKCYEIYAHRGNKVQLLVFWDRSRYGRHLINYRHCLRRLPNRH
jgi:hypothetical protein